MKEGVSLKNMSIDECIDLFETCTSFDCNHCNRNYRGCEDKSKFEEMGRIIVNALKKQRPKTVIGSLYRFTCPNCSKTTEIQKNCNIGLNYCGYCGQKLDIRL